MTQQVIDIGSAPDDGTGDPLRLSFDKTNENFTELYAKGATEGLWNFNQTSTDTSTSPVSGRFKTNSGNYRTATQIAINAITIQGIDRSSTLRTLLVGDLVQCQDSTVPAAWCRYSVQSLPVDHGTWFQLNVTYQTDGGVASGDNQEIIFVFTASSGSGGGGAPVGAEYITSTADATLTAERVLTDTATVTWDRTTAGQIKANAAGGGSSTTIADTPPGSPANGSLWWESDTGTLWISYNDGTSTQWVAVGGGTAPVTNVVKTVPFTASGTWTKQANLIGVTVEVWGGGGGGGNVVNSGGPGGGYARKWYSASALSSTVTVTIGVGGADVGNGGTTTFAATAPVSASGGISTTGPTPGSGSGGDENLTGSLGNATGISGATVAGGGAAPYFGGTPSGGSPVNGAANTGAGGTSAGGAGGSGYCRVTEYYSA